MRKSISGIKNRVFTAVVAISALGLVGPAFADDLAWERQIHLEGTTNTRDIGGYVTGDMQVMRQ